MMYALVLVPAVLAGLTAVLMLLLNRMATARYPDAARTRLGVSPVQRRTVQLPVTPDVAFDHAGMVLSDAQLTVQSRSLTVRSLRARTGPSALSVGEVIEVSVEASPDDIEASTVTVASRPLTRATVIDLGRGAKNVETIVAGLRRPIRRSQRPAPRDPGPALKRGVTTAGLGPQGVRPLTAASAGGSRDSRS